MLLSLGFPTKWKHRFTKISHFSRKCFVSPKISHFFRIPVISEPFFCEMLHFYYTKNLQVFAKFRIVFASLSSINFREKKHKKFAKHRRIIFRNLAFFRESFFSLQKWKETLWGASCTEGTGYEGKTGQDQGAETSCLFVCTKRVCVCNKELNSCTVGVYNT